MIGFSTSVDVPATVRYHKDAVEGIIQSVEERIYCAFLGPRLSGKTLLLRYIEKDLARLLGWTCIYIDLLDIRTATQRIFFNDLILETAQKLSGLTGSQLEIPSTEAGSAVFRAFLADCLQFLQRDLVMIFDPLEALPTDLVQALLTSLRAAYMDQQGLETQVTVIVSGALSLATLTVGESSPFRGIARRIFIGDLSAEASLTLILEFLADAGVNATSPAIQRLLQATCGDIYLIRKISQCCAEHVQSRADRRIHSRDVDAVTNRFLQTEVFKYAPLIEAVRLIEEDPDLLKCILSLMERERLPRSTLPLPLSPDLDPLYLTGVVERDEQEHYRLQNEIYWRFLNQHFSPGRVGYVLLMSGRWDSAIDYLEASIQEGHHQSRADLLTAAINSMYASQDLSQAVYFLQRGLMAAFKVKKSQVWYNPPHERFIDLISSFDGKQPSNGIFERRLAMDLDRLETRTFRQRVTLRGQEGDQAILRAIPLNVSGQKTIGVVTIEDDLLENFHSNPRARDLELIGFLNQAARALQAVGTRRQELALAGRVQASLLPERIPQIPGWGISAFWQPARETAGDFYDFINLPGDRLGIVVADVVDKGMGPALLMTLSRTLIRSFAEGLSDHPEQLLSITNQRIIQDLNAGLFVTMFYGVLDPATGRLVYSNAGQTPPYLLSGSTVNALYRTGMALGISKEESWQRGVVNIPPGAALVLYTDGVVDAQNRQLDLFGKENMLRILRHHQGQSAQAIQDGLLAEISAFAGNSPRVDDITLMILVREP
jgi:hypothetical protein